MLLGWMTIMMVMVMVVLKNIVLMIVSDFMLNNNHRLGGLEGVDANGQKRSFHLSDYKYSQYCCVLVVFK